MKSPAADLLLLLLPALIVASFLATATAQASHTKIGPGVVDALEEHGSACVSILLKDDNVSAIQSKQDSVIDSLLLHSDGDGRQHRHFTVKHRLETVPGLFLQVDSIKVIDVLENNPQVVLVDLDEGGGKGSSFMNLRANKDTRHLLEDAVTLIKANERHAAGNLGSGVVVAVLDSGYDSDHPDLADSLVHEACFLDTPFPTDGCPNGLSRQTGPGSAEDDQRHGTHVASIITSNGAQAPVGVAPNADIVAIKVLDASNRFYSAYEIVAALDYILQNPQLGVRIINMSLATFARFAGECDNATSWTQFGSTVVNNLRTNGVVVFASAGNENDAVGMGFPACLSSVIAVGASDDNDIAASFTNANSETDIFAPGVGIVGSRLGGGTVSLSGTSMASPGATACAALLIESGDAVTPSQVEERFKMSTTTIAKNGFSYPRIDCGLERSGDCKVEYVLFNAQRNRLVGLLKDQIESDGYFCIPHYKVNVQARPTLSCSLTESAYMQLAGPIHKSRTENVVPYTVFGDDPSTGNFYGRSLVPGEYTITSELYSSDYRGGDLVASSAFTYKAKYCDVPKPCGLEYILFDGDSDTPVGPLKEIECVRDNKFNIQARPSESCPTPVLARMKLRGPIHKNHVENASPYMMFGDDSSIGDIFGRHYVEGSYKIEAKIFSEEKVGTELVIVASREFEFEIVNCSRRLRAVV